MNIVSVDPTTLAFVTLWVAMICGTVIYYVWRAYE